MHVEEVKTLEGNRKSEESPHGRKVLLTYSDVVAGIACTVAYIFADGQLVRAKYIETAGHSNNNDYISDYETLQSAVIKKYGDPSQNETFWKNDLYKSDPQEWGMAVAVGHLVKASRWETSRTVIGLILEGDNYDVTLSLEYMSKQLAPLEKAANDAEQEQKF